MRLEGRDVIGLWLGVVDTLEFRFRGWLVGE